MFLPIVVFFYELPERSRLFLGLPTRCSNGLREMGAVSEPIQFHGWPFSSNPSP